MGTVFPVHSDATYAIPSGKSSMVRVSICIDVPDLSVATAFYCDALGCSVVKQQASHNTLSAGGVTMQLLLKDAGTAATENADVRATLDSRSFRLRSR